MTIRAGLLLDGRGGAVRDALITIVGNRIRAVGAYSGGAVSHDLSAYTVLPGLIDAHVHISGFFNARGRPSTGDDGESPAQRAAGRAGNALATLRAGFTTVASMGSDADRELRELVRRGAVPGPRILTSLTPIRDTDLTPAELASLVRRLRRDGADFIKVFASGGTADSARSRFSPAQLAAICGEARRLGLRTVVHAMPDTVLAAVAVAHCDEIEHGFLATSGGLARLAAAGVAFDPQCGLVLRNYLEFRDRFYGVNGLDSAAFDRLAARLPLLPGLIRGALATPGLRTLYGTDAIAGAHGRNAEDLVCRVREAGESPMEALVTATSRNAEALGLGSKIGTVAPGFDADLIALDGNPLEAIEAVRRVKFVMKGGRVFVY